jgi:hypothetical protein
MKTWDELSTAERMSPRKRWDLLAEEINAKKETIAEDTAETQ